MDSKDEIKKKPSKALKRKSLFMDLYEKPEFGLTVVNQERLYICRACKMHTNAALKTEAEWLQHLQSIGHQNAHKSLNLRRYLWDPDRTILISDIMGIHQREILDYLSQHESIGLQFYRPEAIQISNELIHFIGDERKPFKIRMLTDKQKQKNVKARDNYLTGSMTRLAEEKLNEELDEVPVKKPRSE